MRQVYVVSALGVVSLVLMIIGAFSFSGDRFSSKLDGVLTSDTDRTYSGPQVRTMFDDPVGVDPVELLSGHAPVQGVVPDVRKEIPGRVRTVQKNTKDDLVEAKKLVDKIERFSPRRLRILRRRLARYP